MVQTFGLFINLAATNMFHAFAPKIIFRPFANHQRGGARDACHRGMSMAAAEALSVASATDLQTCKNRSDSDSSLSHIYIYMLYIYVYI